MNKLLFNISSSLNGWGIGQKFKFNPSVAVCVGVSVVEDKLWTEMFKIEVVWAEESVPSFGFLFRVLFRDLFFLFLLICCSVDLLSLCLVLLLRALRVLAFQHCFQQNFRCRMLLCGDVGREKRTLLLGVVLKLTSLDWNDGLRIDFGFDRSAVGVLEACPFGLEWLTSVHSGLCRFLLKALLIVVNAYLA